MEGGRGQPTECREVAPMGERGTGAGVRCRRHPAESEVGVGVPKNIGDDKIMK